jgi:hypothetical protein
MPREYVLTPEEAHPIAEAVIRWLDPSNRRHCEIETTPWPDAPLRTTILLRGEPTVLVEAQGKFQYHSSLADLGRWLLANRHYAELYIAVGQDADIPVQALNAMKRVGVGLLMVDDAGDVHVAELARSPALLVNPDPTLRFGDRKTQVLAALEKFNRVDRKDGLRDMCELVERETERLAIAAVRKGLLGLPEAAVQQQDWSSQINTLASSNAYIAPATPLIDGGLKNDIHSFRGARNLIDHPARTAHLEKKRQRQFAERMAQGPRLIAELVSIRRKVKRTP